MKLGRLRCAVALSTLVVAGCAAVQESKEEAFWAGVESSLRGMPQSRLEQCAGEPMEVRADGNDLVYRYGLVHKYTFASSWCVMDVVVRGGTVVDFKRTSANPGGLTDGSSSCGLIFDGCFGSGNLAIQAAGTPGTVSVERMSGNATTAINSAQRYGEQALIQGAQQATEMAQAASRSSANQPTTAPPIAAASTSPSGRTSGATSKPPSTNTAVSSESAGANLGRTQGTSPVPRFGSAAGSSSARGASPTASPQSSAPPVSAQGVASESRACSVYRDVYNGLNCAAGAAPNNVDHCVRTRNDIVRECGREPPSVRTAGSAVGAGNSIGTSRCASASLEGEGTGNPVIRIRNQCSEVINWRLCAKVTSRAFTETPSGTTQSGATSSYTFYARPDEEIRWNYQWCEGRCNPNTPSC